MTKRKIALSALCATLVIGATATATLARPQGPGPGGHGGMMQGEVFVRLLKLADANKDGQISREEFDAARDRLFTEIDADKDGSITPKEFREYREAKLEAFRKDHPRAEGDEARGPDGAPPPPPHEKAGDEGKGPHGEGRHHKGKDRKGDDRRWGKAHGGGMLRMLDTDENGQVSKAEFNTGADRLFERLDRNKDGVINIDDIPDRPFP